jgi:hypothetical protein
MVWEWWLKLLRRWRWGGWWFKKSQVKKFKRPHFNQWLDTLVHICHLSYAGKHK